MSDSFDERCQDIIDYARQSDAQTWTELHNEIYGIGGKVYELFPSKQERAQFLKSGAAAEIRDLIEALPTGPTIET